MRRSEPRQRNGEHPIEDSKDKMYKDSSISVVNRVNVISGEVSCRTCRLEPSHLTPINSHQHTVQKQSMHKTHHTGLLTLQIYLEIDFTTKTINPRTGSPSGVLLRLVEKT